MSPDGRLNGGSPESPAPFGHYELLGPIGSGGMATVYHARLHSDPDQRLAIKCMRPELARDTRFLQMFIREGTLAVLLRHDAIVRSLEFGCTGGHHFIAMEYIAGHDLLHVLQQCHRKRRHLPLPLAVYIAKRLAEGLHFAHTLTTPDGKPLNVVNRDVSPANVRLSWDGQVKLLDFGVARANLVYTSEVGTLKGKLSYMSPEQIRGLPVDARSDVFGTGIVLHEMLTSRRLFAAVDTQTVTSKVVRAEVGPPSARNPRVPAALDAVVMKALARDREERYPSAATLAHDLGVLLSRTRVTSATLSALLHRLYPQARQGAPEPSPETLVEKQPTEPSPPPRPRRGR